MTDEEVMELFTEMQKMFGDDLPNPEQEPIQFAYYIKLYKSYKERKEIPDASS